jgi:hypothetical protein
VSYDIENTDRGMMLVEYNQYDETSDIERIECELLTPDVVKCWFDYISEQFPGGWTIENGVVRGNIIGML